MMRVKRPRTSVDGFIVRRPERGDLQRASLRTRTTVGHELPRRHQEREHSSDESAVHLRSADGNELRTTISESLQAIDQDTQRGKRQRKQQKKKRRLGKIVSIVIALLLLIGIGFVLYKALSAAGRVFQGGIFDIFQQQELKKDAHGRSNVLILGSTDDIAGRDGATLTDSMMVLSVDQKKKDAYMFSIPRDLYVKYDRSCFTGNAGKINAFFICADDGDTPEAEQKRMDATRELVGGIFGMDIQYVVHINTAVIRDAVKAVGGITVNVESRDPRGVLDATFDEVCRKDRSACPRGHYLSFPNGPNVMNGDQAMAFSQARGHTAPTYGLEQSNFDREKNQQLVLMALKEKAASSGTLADLGKVTALMDAMGKNLRTNIETKEIRTIMSLASEISPEHIHRLSFTEEGNVLMTTGNVGAQSIVKPAAGLYQYGQVRSFIRKHLYATEVSKEQAKVMVLNGGGPAGAAQQAADALAELGMEVVSVGNAPKKITESHAVYQVGAAEQKAATARKLQELYGVNIRHESPQVKGAGEVDFVVIVGPKTE